MLRQIKVAKDVAVKAQTAAMISLKAVLVNAPPELRETLQPLSKMALIDHCAGLRPGLVTTVPAATKHTLRSIARRWQQLHEENKTHEALLAELTGQHVPQQVAAFGVGPDTAAELLIVAGAVGVTRAQCRGRPSTVSTRPDRGRVMSPSGTTAATLGGIAVARVAGRSCHASACGPWTARERRTPGGLVGTAARRTVLCRTGSSQNARWSISMPCRVTCPSR